MKITQLELFKVPPRWAFLKVSTDEGLTGWGEPVIEGRASTVIAAVEEMKDYLLGKDPLRIEDHFQVLYRGGFYRGGEILMSAISGIDQALWDIKGKYYEARLCTNCWAARCATRFVSTPGLEETGPPRRVSRQRDWQPLA